MIDVTHLVVVQLAQAEPKRRPWQLTDAEGGNEHFGGLENAADKFTKWNSGELIDPQWLLAGAVFLAGVLLIAAALRRRQPRVGSRPWAVLRAVTGELRLSLADQWMLWRIARYERLPSPLTLVLSPTTLRHHAVEYANNLPATARLRLMQRVRAIRQRMRSEI